MLKMEEPKIKLFIHTFIELEIEVIYPSHQHTMVSLFLAASNPKTHISCCKKSFKSTASLTLFFFSLKQNKQKRKKEKKEGNFIFLTCRFR